MVHITQEQKSGERKGRFVLTEDGIYAGELTYTWAGDSKFIIDHTGVESAFEGKGYARQLVLKAVEFARQEGIKIIPLCPYAKAFFDKTSEVHDVLYNAQG